MLLSPKKQGAIEIPPPTFSVEIVPNKLTWIVAQKPPQEKQSLICFNTERLNHKVSEGLSIQDLSQFLDFVSELLSRHPKIIYFTKNDPTNILIGTVIISLYKIIILNESNSQALKYIKDLNIPFKDFGDPSTICYGVETVISCIGITKAYGFFDRKMELEAEISVKQGTLFRLIPNKLFVFEYNTPRISEGENQRSGNVMEFIKSLKKRNVTQMIGFEGEYEFPYNPKEFGLNGVMHQMITVFNHSEPEMAAIEKGISSIKPEGVYAVNSQDEFGLSMLFVAAYSIKILRYSLEEAICWCRMMVPNCIKESQLLWLKKKYKALAGIDTYVTAEEALKQIKRNGIYLNTDATM